MYFQNFQTKICQDSQFLQENCYQCLNCLIGAQHDPGFLPPILQPTQKYLSSKLFLLNPNFPSCGFYLQKRMLVAHMRRDFLWHSVTSICKKFFLRKDVYTSIVTICIWGLWLCHPYTFSPLFKIYICVLCIFFLTKGAALCSISYSLVWPHC